MSEKNCGNCEFWASYKDELNRGECGMPMQHETRVRIFPLLRKAGTDDAFRFIDKHDEDFPDDIEISFAVMTPEDFCCDSWQEIANPLEEEDDEGEEWKKA